MTKDIGPSRTYRVTVAAYTFKGDGRRSNPVYIKTPKRLPTAPMIRRALLVNPPGSTDVKLTWRSTIPDVLRYKIVYGRALSKFDNLADERTAFVAASTETKDLKGLAFGIWYCFKVSQRIAADWSYESQTWLKMPEGKPNGPPLDIKAITVSATSIKLTWASPDPWLRQGNIVKYVVKYRKVPGGEIRRTELEILSPDTRLGILINGLQVNTRYSFRVAAHTEVGRGPFSSSVTSQTDNKGKASVSSGSHKMVQLHI